MKKIMFKTDGTCYTLEERKMFLQSRKGHIEYSFQENQGQKRFYVRNLTYGRLTSLGISYIIEPDGKGRIVLHNHRVDKK